MKRCIPLIRKSATVLGRWLRRLILALCLLWSLGLWIYQPICLIVPVLTAVLWWWVLRRKYTESALWGSFGLSIVAYLLLPGPQPPKWQTPWEHAPQFTIEGDTLTIRNLRDFHYRSEQDYDPIWRTESYNLAALTGAEFAECHWDGMEAICHTMISFSFADGKHLVVSAETRLPEGETQSAIAGLYKRYGLIYLFGTEQDIYALRTNHRHEDLILIPMKVKPESARKMLLHFVHQAQQAEETHTAYNTLSNNCSSGVMRTFRYMAPNMPHYYDLAPVHNGSISRLLYKHGGLITAPGESYDALRKRCYLRYDICKDSQQDYSKAIHKKIHP